jgi:hypothetical protein
VVVPSRQKGRARQGKTGGRTFTVLILPAGDPGDVIGKRLSKHDRFGAAFDTAAREQHDCASAWQRHGCGAQHGSTITSRKLGSICSSGHHWDTFRIIP